MHSSPEYQRMNRRVAIKWMLSAAASISLLHDASWAAAPGAGTGAKGYGRDPDLQKDYKPGDVWPLTFTAQQRRAALALCDIIIPADEISPKASDLGVHDFIDEWISAPYPEQEHDRPVVLEGLAWIDAESRRRHGADFADLTAEHQVAICDAISNPERTRSEDRNAASFFKRFRDLTAGAFYTTPQGMKDIGYVGNVPLPSYDGPPAEVLRRLGLD